jgi:hypothetical protein
MANTRQRRGQMTRCSLCDKATFQTRGDADRFIRKNNLPNWNPDNMVAYHCPHQPGWHVGHSKTGRPFIDTPKEPDQ